MADVGAMSRAPSEHDAVAAGAQVWWLFLITGSIWLIFSIVVFRFSWTSVSAISILFGIVMLWATVTELLAVVAASGWWKLARLALAVVFLVIAIVAFVHPGNTFAALAAVMSFYFVFKGIFDMAAAIVGWSTVGHAWLLLLLGIAEILVGFWAAGDFGHRQILLIVWVGITALTRGISELLFAFALRGVREAPA